MKGTKSHRERKNGRANDLFIEQKRKKNAARPKQVPCFVRTVKKDGEVNDRFVGWARDPK